MENNATFIKKQLDELDERRMAYILKNTMQFVYTPEMKAITAEIDKFKKICNHIYENGNSAVENNYCNVCGTKI